VLVVQLRDQEEAERTLQNRIAFVISVTSYSVILVVNGYFYEIKTDWQKVGGEDS
jgi:hypothetical protein